MAKASNTLMALEPDDLLQWHALGANAKSLQIKRQQKREWKRGRK